MISSPRAASDTDSESDYTLIPSADPEIDYELSSSQYPRLVSPCERSELQSLIGDVYSALEALSLVDTDLLEQDISPDDAECITHAFNAIMAFLEQLVVCVDTQMLGSDVVTEALHHMCQPQMLHKVFEFRRVFHQMASREACDSATAVVCWVDFMLAKLGEAVRYVVNYGKDSKATSISLGESLLEHKGDGALRAALQLPDTWSAASEIIASKYTSPAAARLTIRLMFAGTVLGCAPGELRGWPYERAVDALGSYICKHGTEDHQSHDTYLAFEDREVLAMAISMLAVADSVEHEGSSPPFRPHMQAILLEQVAKVIGHVGVGSELLAADSIEETEAPLAVLIRWGVAVPWSWKTWNDERLVDYEVVEYLTIAWIYHLERHRQEEGGWEETLLACVSYDPLAACGALTAVLRRCTDKIESKLAAETPSVATLEVLRRGCLGIQELARSLDDDRQRHLRYATSHLCRAFFELGQSAEEMSGKDAIIAAMAELRPAVLSSALRDVTETTSSRSKAKLVAVNMVICTASPDDGTVIDGADCPNVRQLLEFMTLAWQSDVSMSKIFHLGSISSCFDHLLRRFCGAYNSGSGNYRPESSNCEELLPALITALSAMELRKQRDSTHNEINKRWGDGLVWRLMTDFSPEDILITCAFASYIVAVQPAKGCDEVTQCAAWDMLRDFLLLITQRHFIGPQEDLALIVCPLVLEAAGVLLQHAKSSMMSYIMASPWTMTLSNSLCNLSAYIEEGSTNETFVREILVPLGKALAKQMEECEVHKGNKRLAKAHKNMEPALRRHICFPLPDQGANLLLLGSAFNPE